MANPSDGLGETKPTVRGEGKPAFSDKEIAAALRYTWQGLAQSLGGVKTDWIPGTDDLLQIVQNVRNGKLADKDSTPEENKLLAAMVKSTEQLLIKKEKLGEAKSGPSAAEREDLGEIKLPPPIASESKGANASPSTRHGGR